MFHPRTSARQHGADLEILHGRERWKELAPFGYLADAEITYDMRIESGDVAAGKENLAGARPFDAGNGADKRRLAGAVGADHACDLAFCNFQRDRRERLRIGVIKVEVSDFEQRAHISTSSPR